MYMRMPFAYIYIYIYIYINRTALFKSDFIRYINAKNIETEEYILSYIGGGGECTGDLCE